MREDNYTGYSTPGFRGIMAQGGIDNRYFTEDVGYGLVFLADLARHVDVCTLVMGAVIGIASVIVGRDFRAERWRTMAGLGLGG